MLNLAIFCPEAAVALLTLHLLVGGPAQLHPAGWAAAFAAGLAPNAVNFACVSGVIKLHGGELHIELLRDVLVGVLATAVANTSLALGPATLLEYRTAAAFLLAGIAAVLVAAYSGYASLKQRHASLELLYEFLQSMQHAPHDERYVEQLLESARHLLRVESPELLLIDAAEPDLVSRSVLGADGNFERLAPVDRRASPGVAVHAIDRDHYSPRRLMLLGELRDAIAAKAVTAGAVTALGAQEAG